MSPRRSAAEAGDTRARIVARAVDVASLEGLEGLTIGRLAGDLDMSKAGVLGHFGSKEGLQRAAVAQAIQAFREAVWEPAADARPGRPRLEALCDAWIAYLVDGVFPGGCFLTAAACEFDGRSGPVRHAIAEALDRWRTVLADEARRAIDDGDLPGHVDPEQLAFELNAIAMGVNQVIQLHGEPEAAAERGRRAMHRVLHAPDAPDG